MPANLKVMVVGTTSDYIHILRQSMPGRAIFLTDETVRQRATETPPPRDEEIVARLDQVHQVRAALRHHLEVTESTLDGVVCFDDESMELAARLAADYRMPYPSVDAVRRCRDKFRTKIHWQRAGVPCPASVRVWELAEAMDFVRRLDRAVVIKPSLGAGSEMVHQVADTAEMERIFPILQQRLAQRRQHPLYRPLDSDTSPLIVEELVQGEEYSCDFAIDGPKLRILRTARKVFLPGGHLGAVLAYVAPDHPPLRPDELEELLRKAAQALDIHCAICMVDLRVRDGQPMLLELAPRPGGDCLPPLINHAYGLDMYSLALDFASGSLNLNDPPPAMTQHVGLRLLASKAGVIQRLNADAIARDPRVREVRLIRARGHRVRLPPVDYEGWLLGHVIFAPDPEVSVRRQCLALRETLVVEMEPVHG